MKDRNLKFLFFLRMFWSCGTSLPFCIMILCQSCVHSWKFRWGVQAIFWILAYLWNHMRRASQRPVLLPRWHNRYSNPDTETECNQVYNYNFKALKGEAPLSTALAISPIPWWMKLYLLFSQQFAQKCFRIFFVFTFWFTPTIATHWNRLEWE